MFTTAGSTRLTIEANEFDDGMASGMGSGVAPLPANVIVFMAEVWPETIVPIKIPTTRVSATNKPAMAFSRRTQLRTPQVDISFSGSPISKTPVFLSAAHTLKSQVFASLIPVDHTLTLSV